MLQEYDVVALKQSTVAIPLPARTEGTVLLVHPANPPAYEVEFMDTEGRSLGVYSAQDDDLELIAAD